MKNRRLLHLLVALLVVACASGTGTGDPPAADDAEPAAPASPGPASTPPADPATVSEEDVAEEEVPEEAPPEEEEAKSSPAAQYAGDPVAQKRGSDLFRALCTGYCHSTNVAEDTDASYLFDCDWSYGSTDQEIFGLISQGVPETRMQGFGGKLPDEELWKIVSFIRQRSECSQ